MPQTITVTVEASLVEAFRAAADRRRKVCAALAEDDAGDVADRADVRHALAAEDEAAHWLALAICNSVEGT